MRVASCNLGCNWFFVCMEVNGVSQVAKKIIKETLASGVEPLRRVFNGVYDGYDDVPVAYVSETEVFLSATGVLKDYQDAIEEREVGVRWSASNVAAAYRALSAIRSAGKKAAFVTASVTKSFLEGDVENALSALESDGVTGEGIVLAVREKSLLSSQKAKEGIEKARAMGYKVAVFGFSGEQSLNAITTAPVDYAFLAPALTALSGDRDKPGLFTAITTLLRALRVSIVLCGVKTDDVIRDATAAECFGVMPDQTYEGEFSFPKSALALDEVIAQGEGNV